MKKYALIIFLALFSFTFIIQIADAKHNTCTTREVGELVSSGGFIYPNQIYDLNFPPQNILVKDNKPALLGTQDANGDGSWDDVAGGWIIINFGCFADHPGEDLSVYEFGLVSRPLEPILIIPLTPDTSSETSEATAPTDGS